MSGTEIVLKFIAILLAIYGLGLQWWGFFADRRQDRRRCPKCWYDMSGTNGRRCPECGRTAKREVDLLQRRPRFKALALGILMLLSSVLLFVVAEQGYQRMIPDSVLVWMAPNFAGDGGTLEREFERRLRSDELTSDQWASAVQRVLEDQDPIWSVELATRDKWPRDVPLAVAIKATRIATGIEWIDDAPMRLTLTPQFGTSPEPVEFESRSIGPLQRDDPWPVSATLRTEDNRSSLDIDPDSVQDWTQFPVVTETLRGVNSEHSFDVDVALAPGHRFGGSQPARGRRGPTPMPGPEEYVPIESGSASVKVTPVEDLSTPLEGVAPPQGAGASDYLDLQYIAAGLSRQPNFAWTPVLLRRSVSEDVALLDDVVIPIAVELRFDDQPVARGEVAWIDSITLRRMGVIVNMNWNAARVTLSEVPETERDRWSAHGRIDPNLALKFFDHDRYLDIEGEFEIPIEWRR